MSYLVSGNNPAAIKTAERNIFTATAGQTTFTITQGYQVGDIDVFLNGVRLVDSDDYYATNGSTVVLTSGATVGDSLVVVCYRPYQVTDFYTKSEQDTRYVNATGDTMTGQLGVSTTIDNPLKIIKTSGTKWNYIEFYSDAANPTTRSAYIGTDSNGALSLNGNILSDTSGRMTVPNQPRFFARSNYSSGTGPSGVYTFGVVDVNVGNGYNSSNGRFTAPVSGTYYIFAAALSRSASGLNAYLRLNGSNTLVYSEDSRSSGYGDVHPKMLYNLSAGDYIEFYCNNTTYGNVYDYFGGWLVA